MWRRRYRIAISQYEAVAETSNQSIHRQPVKAALQKLTGRGSFGRSVALIAGGTAVGQAVALAVSPLLTRLYTPDEFGLLAVYTSIVALFALVAAMRYELAIPLAVDDEAAANVLALSLLIVLLTSSILLVLSISASERIAALVQAPLLERYLWIVPIGVLGLSCYQVLNQWALRKKDFRRVAQTKVVQSGTLALVQLSCGIAGMGPGGLILGEVLGRSSGSGTLGSAIWKRDIQALRSISLARMRQLANRYSRFPLISSGSAFINSLGLYAPALLLSGFYGPATAGYFALAQRVVSAPMSLLGRSVATVYLAQAAEYARTEPSRLRGLTLRVCKRLFAIGVVPVVLIGITAPWLFRLLFGQEWTEAGSYARWLAIAYLVHFVVVPVSQTLNVLERQDLQAVWDIGRLLLVVAALAGTAMLNLSSEAAVLAYSGAMFLCYLGMLGMVLRVSSQLERSGVRAVTTGPNNTTGS